MCSLLSSGQMEMVNSYDVANGPYDACVCQKAPTGMAITSALSCLYDLVTSMAVDATWGLFDQFCSNSII